MFLRFNPDLLSHYLAAFMQDLHHFFAARHFKDTDSHLQYDKGQWGSQLHFPAQEYMNWDDAEIVIIGCGECRGSDPQSLYTHAADAIRKQLYQLYNWHATIVIADAGNILQGSSLEDTRAALRIVLQELHEEGKIAIVLGGSHDLTMQQYQVFQKAGQFANLAIADMLIDLDESETITDRSFLMDMIGVDPSFIKHYSHLAFQSYYTPPRMLETLDKLRFDFTRVGVLKEHIDEAEPALRTANIFSFDMNAVRFSDAPANSNGSPNGLAGEEACALMRYAGMSPVLTSLGIYGYNPDKDVQEMTARLIAQMIWYFVEGRSIQKTESAMEDKNGFVEFHVSFTANDTIFLKSKRTSRWWMQMPDKSMVPCSYGDYLTACKDEIPERWLREQERLV